MSSGRAAKARLNSATSNSTWNSSHSWASDQAPRVAAAMGHGERALVGDEPGLEHAGRAVHQQAHRVGPPGGEVAPLEHALVEAGTEKEGGVRRQVAGVVAGAQAAALVGSEERVELSRYVALAHGPGPGGGFERLPAGRGEAAEAVGEPGHDEPPALSRGQVHLGGLADSEDLVGGRIAALLRLVGAALKGLRADGAAGPLVGGGVLQGGGVQAHGIDPGGDFGAFGFAGAPGCGLPARRERPR